MRTLTSKDAQFEAFMADTRQQLFRALRQRCNDRELIQEIVQESFIKAYRSGKLDRQHNPSAWIIKIAIRTLVDHWRNSENKNCSLDGLPEQIDREPNAEALLMRLLTEETVATALKRISIKQRTLIGLRYFEQKSVEDIAEILGIPPSNAKTQLHRAIVRLRIAVNEINNLETKIDASATAREETIDETPLPSREEQRRTVTPSDRASWYKIRGNVFGSPTVLARAVNDYWHSIEQEIPRGGAMVFLLDWEETGQIHKENMTSVVKVIRERLGENSVISNALISRFRGYSSLL